MTTATWDVEFLKARDRDAQESEQAAQNEADWECAIVQMRREASDANDCHRICPVHACIRARRCAGDPEYCLALSGVTPPFEAERDRIDEIYEEMQLDRRFAAEQGDGEDVAP